MKYYFVFFLLMFYFVGRTQEKYSDLIEKAQNKAWNAKDDKANQFALDLFENAFSAYPDSISGPELYEVSVLLSKLKKYGYAFAYLTKLLDIKYEADGYPTWDYILGKNSDIDYINLLTDSKWGLIKNRALQDKESFFNSSMEKQKEFYDNEKNVFKEIKNPKKLYKALQEYHLYKEKKERDYSIIFNINDSTSTSYFVHLPKNYDPQKKYALLFFLHGAVRGSELIDFQLASWNLEGWNRYYTKYADLNEVVLVFPQANKTYNWMLSDDGFFMVPDILKNIKKAIHIDDDKVFISGHSNGATGSFSYLMKQPTPFAGFYGFNTYPKVFTGGTFIENIKNRSFINFSTDQDYYYPPNANDELVKLTSAIHADYKDYRYNGYPHWFPEFDESEPAYKILFDDLNARKRNPYPSEIHWQFDDNKYGTIDWIAHAKLDTLSAKATAQKKLNFKIDQWLVYDKNDSLVLQEVNKQAFDFPRKSGKIIASYNNNVFKIETSNIKSFAINISPEMVAVNKKIKVYVNDKLYVNKKVKYNRAFILMNFNENQDRKQIWINQINIQVE